jgi:hypothetical protein
MGYVKLSVYMTRKMRNDIWRLAVKDNISASEWVEGAIIESRFLWIDELTNRQKSMYGGRKDIYMGISLEPVVADEIRKLSERSGVPMSNIIREACYKKLRKIYK